jgi:hypothetical protein
MNKPTPGLQPGRHRRHDFHPGKTVLSHTSEEWSGETPEPIPPHPPLASGPGHHAFEPAERSVGLAVLLSGLLGPIGAGYATALGGVVCTGLTAIALVALGPWSLLAAWPVSMAVAVAWARRRPQGWH